MHDDHNPSLAFRKNGLGWKCFVCDKGGNAVGLVMARLGCDFKQACEWLCQEYGISREDGCRFRRVARPQINRVFRPVEKELVAKPVSKVVQWVVEQARLSEEARKFLFEERKLKESVVRQLHIGSINDANRFIARLCSEFTEDELLQSGLVGKGRGGFYPLIKIPCLLFPYYDYDSVLIGLQFRMLRAEEAGRRFQFLGGRSVHVFNLPLLKSLPAGATVYVSEGVTDCMAMLSDGLPAIAIPSATIIPNSDLERLVKYKLCMFPDRDDAGQKGLLKLWSQITKRGGLLLKKQIPEGFKDYGDYYRQKES